MRKTKFDSVQSWQDAQSDGSQEAISTLRKFFPSIEKGIEETLKFNLCFYTYQGKLLAYLNVENKNKKKGIVTLGLCQGVKLIQQYPQYKLMLRGDGTMVKKLFFGPDDRIYEEVIKTLIHQSIELL